MGKFFLFTGENLYELSKEKGRWLQAFTGKHGEENLSRLQAKDLSFTALLDAVSAAPFIAESRLTVIDGIPKLEKDQIDALFEAVHPQSVVLVTEPKPDKRLTASKEFLKRADVKTFDPLPRKNLLTWAMAFATEEGAKLSQATAIYLVDVVGEDQMLLSNEIRKLTTAAFGREISRTDIDDLVLLSAEQAGWKVMDMLAEGKTEGAMLFLRKIMAKGESPHALWSMLLWIVSQVVLVGGAVQEGQTSPAAVCKTAGVSFPTARTLTPFVRGLRDDELKTMVRRFITADIELKTGGYRATAEAPEELTALIDCCVGSFPRS